MFLMFTQPTLVVLTKQIDFACTYVYVYMYSYVGRKTKKWYKYRAQSL